ncbi:hypothetical protein JD969_11775 [Planctomycetota bacterium]|nr:hypothetical protein JD969_11775 [Planctomycetota bacterium]
MSKHKKYIYAYRIFFTIFILGIILTSGEYLDTDWSTIVLPTSLAIGIIAVICSIKAGIFKKIQE